MLNLFLFFILLHPFSQGTGLHHEQIQLIYSMQDQHVTEQTCAPNWRELLSEGSKFNHNIELEKNLHLVTLPCSNWAVNFVTTAFLVNTEKSNEVRPLLFKHQKPKDFNSMDQSNSGQLTTKLFNLKIYKLNLYSDYYVKSYSQCGTKSTYVWNKHLMDYELLRQDINNNCY